jgi:hypothetical protein
VRPFAVAVVSIAKRAERFESLHIHQHTRPLNCGNASQPSTRFQLPVFERVQRNSPRPSPSSTRLRFQFAVIERAQRNKSVRKSKTAEDYRFNSLSSSECSGTARQTSPRLTTRARGFNSLSSSEYSGTRQRMLRQPAGHRVSIRCFRASTAEQGALNKSMVDGIRQVSIRCFRASTAEPVHPAPHQGPDLVSIRCFRASTAEHGDSEVVDVPLRFQFAVFERVQRNCGCSWSSERLRTVSIRCFRASTAELRETIFKKIMSEARVSIRCFRASTAEPYPSVRACDQRRRGVHAHRRRRRARPWGVVAAVGASVQFRRVHTGAREGATAHPLSSRGGAAPFTRCCQRAAQNRTRSGGLAWPT